MQKTVKSRIGRIFAAPIITVLLLGAAAMLGCSDSPPPLDMEDGAASPEAPMPPEQENPSGEEAKADGYLLTVDGKEIAYIEDEADLKAITELLLGKQKSLLAESGKTVDKVEILSTFNVELQKCEKDSITDAEGAVEAIEASGIKITYAVTELEILPIAYETVYKNSSSYYEGVQKVHTVGKNGEKQMTYRVTYEDSKETDKSLTEEKTLTKPTDKVVLVGTKKSTASTGTYAWPTKSVYITSKYGWRTIFGNREYHYGIDLRAAVGTSIYASDGGEVIFVGTSSGYGKLIRIRHDNGDETYYAHLNSYSVKKGDRVYKGQLIAKSGQTGRVTGPHLHFEIRKNGTRVDPEKYLPKV